MPAHAVAYCPRRKLDHHHPGAVAHCHCVQHADPGTDGCARVAHRYSDDDAVCDSVEHPDGDSVAHSVEYADGDSHGDAYGHGDEHADSDTHGHGNEHADRDTHGHGDQHTRGTDPDA